MSAKCRLRLTFACQNEDLGFENRHLTRLSPIGFALITRMPKRELQAVLIKQPHNVASNDREYPLKLPRIMHECM